jgi:ABC-2 type transport system ATP-binding protein
MLIKTEHLKFSLSRHAILHDINLQMARGQIYGLLGPNGAGKSTTIAVILGLYEATGGTVELFDQSDRFALAVARCRVGVMPEHAGFYGWMGAADYLSWFSRFFGKAQQAPRDVLRQVGLEDAGNRPIDRFSHGMRQRLALARALIHAPELLILDEPTNGLDPRGRREMHDLLLNLAHEKGVGILLCTHLLDDVERLCTHVGILDHGTTIREGSLADVLQRDNQGGRFGLRLAAPPPAEDLPEGGVLLGRNGDWWHVALAAGQQAEPGRYLQKLLSRGWPVVELKAEGGGLEEVYMRLTHQEKTPGKEKSS